jgi:hypothetical protein
LVEDKQAAHIFTVKDNQKPLKQDIAALNLVSVPPSTPNY